jgi:hypothetical protein
VSTSARYLQLLNRALFELRQAGDVAIALGLEQGNLMRLKRAKHEIFDEIEAVEAEKARAETVTPDPAA